MRSLVAAVVALLPAAPSARADYLRLSTPKPDTSFALQGDNVLVGAANVLTSHAPDGTSRVIPLPRDRGDLRSLTASDEAIGLELSVTDHVALEGKPWRRLGGMYTHSTVMGSKALVTRDHDDDERGSFDVIDLRTGRRTHFPVAEDRPAARRWSGTTSPTSRTSPSRGARRWSCGGSRRAIPAPGDPLPGVPADGCVRSNDGGAR